MDVALCRQEEGKDGWTLKHLVWRGELLQSHLDANGPDTQASDLIMTSAFCIMEQWSL